VTCVDLDSLAQSQNLLKYLKEKQAFYIYFRTIFRNFTSAYLTNSDT